MHCTMISIPHPRLALPSPRRDFCAPLRFLNFLGVLTIEAFTASAMGMLIGCLAKDGDAALAIGPPIMTIFILFSGGVKAWHEPPIMIW